MFFFAVTLQSAHGETKLTDQAQRRVTIPSSPARIISLAPSITEMICGLDQCHRLVAVTQFSDRPAHVRTLPKVGSYNRFDIEKIVALKPDLCIATRDGNPKISVDQLTSLGIPVLVINPRQLEDIKTGTVLIGKALGCEPEANAAAAGMAEVIEASTTRLKTYKTRPRVLVQIVSSPVMVAGAGTLWHELISLSGGINIAPEGLEYPILSPEQMIALSPDVILVCTMGGKEETDRAISSWAKWVSVPAVKNNRVHVVDGNIFNRPTAYVVNGIPELIRLFHPHTAPEAP